MDTYQMSQLVGYEQPSGEGGNVLKDGGPLKTGDSDVYTGIVDDGNADGGYDDRYVWGITKTDQVQTKQINYWSIPNNYHKMDFTIRKQWDMTRPADNNLEMKSRAGCWLGPTTQNTDPGQYWNPQGGVSEETAIWKTTDVIDESSKAFQPPDSNPKLREYLMFARIDDRKDNLYGLRC